MFFLTAWYFVWFKQVNLIFKLCVIWQKIRNYDIYIFTFIFSLIGKSFYYLHYIELKMRIILAFFFVCFFTRLLQKDSSLLPLVGTRQSPSAKWSLLKQRMDTSLYSVRALQLTFHSSSHSLSSRAFLCRRTRAFTSDCTTLALISTCSAMAWTFSMLSCERDRGKSACNTALQTNPLPKRRKGIWLCYSYVTLLMFASSLHKIHILIPSQCWCSQHILIITWLPVVLSFVMLLLSCWSRYTIWNVYIISYVISTQRAVSLVICSHSQNNDKFTAAAGTLI